MKTHAATERIASLARTYSREITVALMLIAGVLLAHFGVFRSVDNALGLTFDAVALLWYLAAVAPVAWVVLKDAWSHWRKGDFMNEFTLMLIASAGAFAIGEYPEAVAVLLFYSFGEKMEDTASADVRTRIRNLIGRLPDKAFVEQPDGSLRQTDPKDVAPGTIIVVRPGERVPVDGELQSDGDTPFDTSSITGESVPRSYTPGSEIMSGMIPVDRTVRLKTLRPFADSSMSRMMQLIEKAAGEKSPTETMLRRITRYYTPAVLLLAVLVFTVPWIVSLFPGAAPFAAETWFRRTLVFLVCSCPCALVVSVPLSYFASMGSASRLGLLFKDSAHIDLMRKIDTLVFDKTGTLTTGQFHIVNTVPAGGYSADRLVALAAAVDAGSAHPLAKAIVAAAAGGKLPDVADVRTISHGMEARSGEKTVLVGSRKLMGERGVEVPPPADAATEVCVAVDGDYKGSIYLSDTLKPEAVEAIAEIKRLGVKRVVILSGDMEQAVAAVGRKAGADAWKSQLLPADKQREIERMRAEGHRVAFAGDGVNDAPALTSADIGIAMGTHGSDMAMESADVVIAGDNLLTIPDAIRLSRRVKRVVTENVVFAIGVKLVVMVLGAFGIATLWAAVFADTGVTALTILWTVICLMLFDRLNPRRQSPKKDLKVANFRNYY